MNDVQYCCPGGRTSQTGTAILKRYGDVGISKLTFDDIIKSIPTQIGPFVTPIWNSHEGEIGKAEFVWDLVESSDIKLMDIWAKRIEFWYLRRRGSDSSFKKVGSVSVARTQCSDFFEKNGFELVDRPLTTDAFDDFHAGAEWDGVLVADGQEGSKEDYEIAEKRIANANNFTSFVQFVPTRGFASAERQITSWLTAVTMRSFGPSIGDIEQSFFEEMLNAVTDLKDMPKPIFILRRTAKVGLLFEGAQLRTVDLLSADEMERGGISVCDDAGATEKPYSKELALLFEQTFPELHSDDFVLQKGVNTYLFACPPLGLYTHGYEISTVEPVFRFYVDRIFNLWDKGVTCTGIQDEFFNRYAEAWREARSKFIQFKVVGTTACS